jgi:hypothetical protein
MSNRNSEQSGICRRDLLVGMGLTAMAYTPVASAMEHEHAKHDHSKHKPQQEGVLESVNVCLDKGQRCIAHCLTMFQREIPRLQTALLKCMKCRRSVVASPTC